MDESASSASWIESIPLYIRLLYLALPTAIGLCLAILLWANLSVGDGLDLEIAWVGLFPLGIGLFFGWRAYKKREVRRFATQEVTYTVKQRLVRASKWWGAGIVCIALVWIIQATSGYFYEYWWYAWLGMIITLPGFWLYLMKRERVLTPEAFKYKFHYLPLEKQTAEAQEKQVAEARSKVDGDVIDKPLVRYPIAALFFYVAYHLWFENQDLDAVSIIILIFAVSLAYELSLLIFGLAVTGGILWAIFAGISALPVSVAVIIGALIIAGAIAMKR